LIHDKDSRENIKERYVDTQTQTMKASPITCNISSQNINFVGRNETLRQLKESLNQNSSCAILHIIRQILTQSAKKYAFDNDGDYACDGAIIWSVDAGEGKDLDQQYQSLARSLNVYHESLGVKEIKLDHEG